jgi:hypothetical protein
LESLAPLPVEVSTHSSSPPNPWEGYKLALSSGLADPAGPTHVLVLQEDVVVCQNFPEALARVRRAKSFDPVSLFLARLPGYAGGEVFRAWLRGERYLRAYPGDKFFPALAILWPAAVAHSFFAWVNDPDRRLPGYPNPPASDDAVFGEWIRRTQRDAWYTVPSLVDHPDQVESVIGKTAQWGRDRNRTARLFCEKDALDYDW